MTKTNPGLCVDAGTTRSASGTAVTLRNCPSSAKLADAPYYQQWSLDGSAEFLATTADRKLDPTYCLGVATPDAAQVLVESCPGSYNARTSWLPSPSVGAGAAGPDYNGLVNFSQFGRCADVTNQSAPTGSADAKVPFMILYPCKQDPAANPPWNQRFAYNTATGQFITNNGKDYCLTSAASAGGYVGVYDCASNKAAKDAARGTDALQRWTEFGVTKADQTTAGQYPYDVRFTVKDSNGLCLSLTPINGPKVDVFSPSGGSSLTYSKLAVEQCDGSTRQKWNADPYTPPSAVQNTTEK